MATIANQKQNDPDLLTFNFMVIVLLLSSLVIVLPLDLNMVKIDFCVFIFRSNKILGLL